MIRCTAAMRGAAGEGALGRRCTALVGDCRFQSAPGPAALTFPVPAMSPRAAAAPRHAPRSLAARPAARRRFTVSAGSGRAAEDLAKQVAAKEAELQNMFVSGRIPKVCARPRAAAPLLLLVTCSAPPQPTPGAQHCITPPPCPPAPAPAPQAAVVAAMRKELADLRAELSGELGSATPHSVRGVPSAAASRPTGYPGASGGSILDSAPSSSSSATSSRMLNALKLVEAQLSVGTQGASLGGLSFEQQQELLQLQEENTRLK